MSLLLAFISILELFGFQTKKNQLKVIGTAAWQGNRDNWQGVMQDGSAEHANAFGEDGAVVCCNEVHQ
jgi:hypothetical protein